MENKMLLPNFYGIFEVKSATKNRIRVEIDKLKNSPEYAKLVKKYFPEHYDNFIANQKKK